MMWAMLICCGAGALERYVFAKVNSIASLPIGTLLVNLLGAFLIGYFYHHIEDKQPHVILGTGFCRGLTTFSTLNAELAELFSERKKFVLYLALTYILGFLAILLGIFI